MSTITNLSENKMNNQKLYEEAELIFETVEDTVSYLCDENKLSGEKVWSMIHAMAEGKLRQFPGYYYE